MFTVRALVLAIALCGPVPASGARIARKKTGVSCASLGGIQASNQSFGVIATWVCQAWPQALGPFPIQTAPELAKLLHLAFSKGGVWSDMKQIWSKRREQRFCWRNETLRDVIPATSNMPCQLRSNGTCYGHCPRGHKSGSLLGLFKPVCKTICGDTFHHLPCGYGCATSTLNCMKSLMDQVGRLSKDITRSVSRLVSDGAAAIVEKVIAIVEFMIEVLPRILKTINKMSGYTQKGQKEVAFFMMLFQFVSEVYPYGYNSREMWSLKAGMGEVIEYVFDAVDGNFSKGINFATIRGTLVKHAEKFLGLMKIVTKAYDYPKCGEMEQSTMFAVEGAGDEKVVGPWVRYYEHNRRPSYARSTSSKWRLEYSKSKKAWRILSPKNWLGQRDTLYSNPSNNSDYPLLGWVAKKAALPVPELLPAQFSCQALEQLVVNGRGFGSIAGVVCQFWPESLGLFPLRDEREAFDVLEKAFGEGGLWDQIDEVRKARKERPDFCWRKEADRPVLPSGQGCKMVSKGVCYGECPWGYKKSTLKGYFAPVCTSACGESEYGFPCGFGCAAKFSSCVSNLKDQVGELTRYMGDVAGLVLGNSSISDMVEKVTYIAEFFLQILPNLVKKAKKFWAEVREDQAEVALIMVLIQYIKEHGNFDEEFEVLRDNIGSILEMIAKLIQSNFKLDEVNMDVLKDVLASATDKLISSIVGVTEQFLYRRCNPAESNVDFSIDEAGDEKVLGLWTRDGTENGRDRFELRTNDDVKMVWRKDTWQIRCKRFFILNRTLYKSAVNSPRPPAEGWEAVDGDAPAPELIPLK